MRPTRTSARLAEAAKKAPDEKASLTLSSEVDAAMLNIQKGEAHDFDFEAAKEEKEEDIDFEEVVASPPKHKRTGSAKSKATAPRKGQVRGKQGRLADLVKMPIDVFTEIVLYLMPKDIISLSRLNKFFHSLLMRRSALHIWHGAMRNVPGLPPCPPDMIEPHYLALIYARDCMACGATVNHRMDELLRTRLCISCKENTLIERRDVPHELFSLVLHSGTIMRNKKRHIREFHALKCDVEQTQARLDEINDSQTLLKWKAERMKIVCQRRTQASKLIEFLDQMERERIIELDAIKAQHRIEVESRLLEEGWQLAELEFSGVLEQKWIKLVEQARLLTDRAWTSLKPKLAPVLEANRAERLQREEAN